MTSVPRPLDEVGGVVPKCAPAKLERRFTERRSPKGGGRMPSLGRYLSGALGSPLGRWGPYVSCMYKLYDNTPYVAKRHMLSPECTKSILKELL